MTKDHILIQLKREEQLNNETRELLQKQICSLLHKLSALKGIRTQLLADFQDKGEAIKLTTKCIAYEPDTPTSQLPANQYKPNHVTYDKWLSRCKDLRLTAGNLIKESTTFRGNLRFTIANMKNAHEHQRRTTHDSLKKKINELSRIQDMMMWERQQVKDEISDLTKDVQKVTGHISNCESRLYQATHRLDILNQRPGHELCLDQPHISLTLEKEDLTNMVAGFHPVLKHSEQELMLAHRRLMTLEDKMDKNAQTLNVEQKCQNLHQSFLPALDTAVILANKPQIPSTMGRSSPHAHLLVPSGVNARLQGSIHTRNTRRAVIKQDIYDLYGLISRRCFEVNMGCSNSTTTAVVQPHSQEEVNGDEEETGSKLGSRGDSAVSKGTTDSGVVMENKEIPALPGVVPRQLPPLTSEHDRESEAASPGLLQKDSRERQKSCDILEELLCQGIIPVGQSRQGSSSTGEAYSIMLEDSDVRRKPPARLESLKANNVRNVLSREEIDEKIRVVEERRKLREDELKMRLRAKSARGRVRAPVTSTEEEEGASITPVDPQQSLLSPSPTPAPLDRSQTAAVGGDCVREAAGDNIESGREMGQAEMTKGNKKRKASGHNGGESAEWVSGGGDGEKEEEELEEVEELQAGQRLTASVELESDSSFQCEEDKEETF
ncbi:hypothetical protein INR49_031804 [Caranx melampygus]|nr:hypothetical protein INR49_031804 [Caranx melampygus]